MERWESCGRSKEALSGCLRVEEWRCKTERKMSREVTEGKVAGERKKVGSPV